MKAMCVTNTKRVQKEIADSCGDDKEDALKEYAETCADNDHKVGKFANPPSTSHHQRDPRLTHAEIASKSSDSASKTGGSHSSDSSASATGGSSSSDDSSSSKDSSSGSSTGSSASASASPSDSVSAGSSDRHVSAAAFAAVVFLGFAATM